MTTVILAAVLVAQVGVGIVAAAMVLVLCGRRIG
jgi:hypothetical protein